MLQESTSWRFWIGLMVMLGAGLLTLTLVLLGSALFSSVDDAATATGAPPLLVESEPLPTLSPSPTLTQSPTPATRLPSTAISSSTVAPPTASPQVAVAANSECPPPADWVGYTVEAGDTLFAFQLGSGGAATVDDIIAANCLEERIIYEGQLLFLPPGAAENAPSSEVAPTAAVESADAPPPPAGLTRNPNCPCEVVIAQGLRLEQVAELIDSLPLGFTGADLMALRIASLPARESFGGAPANATLEGYLLPGSYVVSNEMDAVAFVNAALDALDSGTGAGFWADAGARGLTPYDALTLASIINREARSPNQQPLVGSVFHNRLNADMGLGATVTTQYALGRSGDWWPNAHGQVATYDSPYNTNLYQGLPPSPIVSPSLEALRAAVYPAETGYIYFTGNCNGSGNVYAETYEQHLANVRCE